MFFFSTFLTTSLVSQLYTLPAKQSLPEFEFAVNDLIDRLVKPAKGAPESEALLQLQGAKKELSLRSLRQVIYQHDCIKNALTKDGKELQLTHTDCIRILLAKRMTHLRIPIENRIKLLETLPQKAQVSILLAKESLIREVAYSSLANDELVSTAMNTSITIEEDSKEYQPLKVESFQKVNLNNSRHPITLEWKTPDLPTNEEELFHLITNFCHTIKKEAGADSKIEAILQYAQSALLPDNSQDA